MTQELLIPERVTGKIRDSQDSIISMKGYNDVFQSHLYRYMKNIERGPDCLRRDSPTTWKLSKLREKTEEKYNES